MLEASLESRVGPNPPLSREGLRFRLPSSRREGGAEAGAAEEEEAVLVDSFSRAF